MECCSCKRQVRSLTMVPNYMRIPHMCKYAHSSSSSTGSHRSWREIDAPISFEQANFGDCMCQKTTLAVSESHLPLLFLWNSIPQFPQKILYVVYRLQHPTGISGIFIKADLDEISKFNCSLLAQFIWNEWFSQQYIC